MLETILWAAQVDSDPILVWLIWSSSFITCGLDAVLIGWTSVAQSYFILFAIISPSSALNNSSRQPIPDWQSCEFPPLLDSAVTVLAHSQWTVWNVWCFQTETEMVCWFVLQLEILLSPCYWRHRQLYINKRSIYSDLQLDSKKSTGLIPHLYIFYLLSILSTTNNPFLDLDILDNRTSIIFWWTVTTIAGHSLWGC